MKSFLENLKRRIEADPLTFYDGGDIPALESLYFHYTECYCIGTAQWDYLLSGHFLTKETSRIIIIVESGLSGRIWTDRKILFWYV